MEEFKGVRLFLYSASTAGFALLDSIWLTFMVVFFLPPKELVAEGMVLYISNETFFGFITMLGAVTLLGRIVDSIADPLVAFLSDRSRAKWGRRRSFMLFGGLPLAICSALLFFPPVFGISWLNALYLALVFSLYFIFFTMYVCPYLALIPELGTTEKSRLKITTTQGYFSLLGSGAVMIGGPLLLDFFMITNPPAIAYQRMVILLSVLGALFLYLAVFAVDEKKFSNAVPSNFSLANSWKETLKNKSFQCYLVAILAMWFIFTVTRSAAIHLVVTLMQADIAMAATLFTLIIVVAAICFPFVSLLVKKWGKKTVMLATLASFSLFSLLMALTGLIPVNPVTWGLIVAGLLGLPVAVLLVLPNVIVSEICDADYKKTGERREAMYFGIQGLFQKINLGLATASLAFMFATFGKDIANPLGVRLSFVLGSIVALIGIIGMSRYDASE